MASKTFSETYSVSYWGSITAQVRLTFSESYTAATNKSVVTLTGIEFKKNGDAVVGTINVYGTVAVDGTTVCTIDNTTSGKKATVYLTGNDWCSADLSNVTITPVTVTHNDDGSKSVTVALSGGNDSRFCAYYSWYHQYATDPATGHALYRTDIVRFGVSVPTSASMALTSHTRQWTVSYNANGHGTAPASQTKTYGVSMNVRPFIADQTGTKSTYTLTGNANGGTWSGSNGSATKTPTYIQTKWNTKADGTGTGWNSEEAYTRNESNLLYAIWGQTTYSYTCKLPTGTPTKTQSRTVSYNANGGTGAPASQSTSRSMVFNGWYTAASGGSQVTTSSQYSANATVYAQFGDGTSNYPAITISTTKPTKASTSLTGYTVTYNYNGNGQSNTTATASRATVYTFSKWNTAANGSGTNYSSGGTYSSNTGRTLYAQYTSEDKTYAVTLPSPTRSGYTLKGWYTASSGGTKAGNGGASYTPSGNVTLYAQWTGLASTISSCSSSVSTTTDLTLTVSRNNSAYYHKATFKIGSTTLATSSAFATSLTYTVPRTWFNSYPNDTSKTVTVSVQTYTTSACTTTVGDAVTTTFTMKADSGMKPSVSSDWVSHTYYNTGTDASSIAGYVKGYSKATITFDTSKITLMNSATIASYSITCQGSTDSSSPYRTPVLTSTSVPVVCTVTDSRGRTASDTITITVMDYAKPKLKNISVFRCDENGNADEDGTYYSVKATTQYSSLNGANSCTLTGKLKAAGGSFGTAYSLTSGTASVKGTISTETSYTVRLTATDALGNTVTYDAQIPTRKWAMKFRPTGNGVAFGKTAEYDNTFEITSDWDVKFGNLAQVKNHLGLGDFEMTSLSAAADNGTATFTIENSERGIILALSASANLNNIYTYNCTSAGAVTCVNYRTASDITMTTGTNSVTFTNGNSSNNLNLRKIKL